MFFQTNTFCGIFLLFINGYKLERLIERARAFSRTVLQETSPAIVQQLNKQHELIHKVTRIFFIVVTYAAHFYVFAPILSTLYTLYGTTRNVNETVHYTLHMEENFYGLPTRTSGPYYLLFSAIMTPTSYLCAFAGTVKILTISNFIIYCTLYFQLVQVKLRTVAQENSFRQELKAIVTLHQDALNCAKLLESITSLVLLQQLLLCVLIWCSMLLYFTVSSAQVAHEVYECRWELQTTAIQKDLKLVLVRAQTPVGITAGKFCYMNMEQFGIVS
uniref:Odorant receptor n=1 Tax=Anopheles maculatus TaxID=74869 RepID=A0A182T9R2_9DIPT